MKVIAISEFGGTENFFEVERDTPRPRADEVLIRIRAGSFNPIDYKIRQGRYDGDLPMVLGHDAAGVVEEVGSSVGRLRVGDEVWAYLGARAATAPTPSMPPCRKSSSRSALESCPWKRPLQFLLPV